MALGILTLGHGGGVPGPIKGTPIGSFGNTNFAIIPDLHPGVKLGSLKNVYEVLDTHPYYLLDCGTETTLRLCGVFPNTKPVSQNIKGIFITHCHDDHSGGLKSLAYRMRFVDKIQPKLIYPQALNLLLKSQTVEFSYLDTPNSHFEDSPFYKHHVGETYWGKGFRAIAFPVEHNCIGPGGKPFPAYGYQITTDKGSTITFSGDTAFPIPPQYFSGSDWIIHDVQFYNDGSKGDHVHCPYKLLRDAVKPEDRHKVLLTHTGHDLPPEALADGFKLFRGGNLLILE